jgi:hypothetical protein
METRDYRRRPENAEGLAKAGAEQGSSDVRY